MSRYSNIISLFILITICLTIVKTGVIIPDKMNPFLITTTDPITMYFNFQLPSNSLGLGYKQLIAVQFPSDKNVFKISLDQGISSDGTSSYYSCNLSDNTLPLSPIKIQMSSVPPTSQEGSTFLCRIDDLLNSLSSGKNYGLKITFTVGLNPISPFQSSNLLLIRQISLFTTSSTINPSERIIIDNNPNFSEVGINFYNSASTNSPLAFASTTNSISVDLNTPFTMTFDVVCNSYFRGEDTVIVLEWNSSLITRFSNLDITTSDIAVANPSESQKAYRTNSLNLINIEGVSNRVIINGIGNDLTVNRMFKLNIQGLSTTNNYLPSIPGNVSLYLFYKNSYSILSMNTFNLVSIKPLSFPTFTAKPYDGWSTIRQGGAWNIQFSFTPSQTYQDSGYIIIRQTNAMINVSKLNFLASTCDFTPMIPSIIASNSFGIRPICYPLRMDYNYKNNSGANSMTSAHDGSGIFFKLPRLNMVSHSVNVFIFSEFCNYPTTLLNGKTSVFSLASGDSIYNYYQFRISFYKSGDPTKVNEYRFPESSLLGYTNITSEKSVKCVSNYWVGYDQNRGAFDLSLTYATATTQNNSIFLYKEINDFVLHYINVNNSED
jgi:hypothetical protein